MENIVFILIFTSLLIAFNINPLKRKIKISDLRKNILKSKRERIIGKNLNLIERLIIRIEGYLKRLGKNLSYFYFLLIVAFISGSLLGNFLYSDLFLSLVMGICFLPVPYLYLQIKTSWYIRNETEKLENAMSIITNTYISCDDIQKSFELYIMEERRYNLNKNTAFSEFLSEIVYINPNVTKALIALTEKIQNQYFTQWVKMLMLCNNDRRLKFALRPILDTMNDAKSIAIENETMMMRIWRDYFGVVVILLMIIPMFKTMNKTWFEILTKTTLGKSLIVIMLVSIVISGFFVMKINKPVGTSTVE